MRRGVATLYGARLTPRVAHHRAGATNFLKVRLWRMTRLRLDGLRAAWLAQYCTRADAVLPFFNAFVPQSARWSPDGVCLLTNSDDNVLRVYDVPPDALVCRCSTRDLLGGAHMTTCGAGVRAGDSGRGRRSVARAAAGAQ